MHAQARFAVAGATGRVGRHAVELLEAAGRDVVRISRTHGVDLLNGNGLANALEGVECVIDAAAPSPDRQAVAEFFTAVSGRLHAIGTQAGVQRMVTVSIIGCDQFTAGWGAAAAVHERAMLAGPLPARVLRAAQFHELIAKVVEWGTRGDVSYVPKMRIQPVAARAVARALVDVATDASWAAAPRSSEPPIPEIAGPREESMVDVARLLVTRRGDALRIEGVSDPADPDHSLYETGGLLPGPGATLAGPTFETWLEATLRGSWSTVAVR